MSGMSAATRKDTHVSVVLFLARGVSARSPRVMLNLAGDVARRRAEGIARRYENRKAEIRKRSCLEDPDTAPPCVQMRAGLFREIRPRLTPRHSGIHEYSNVAWPLNDVDQKTRGIS
jgi:hypothetical protein